MNKHVDRPRVRVGKLPYGSTEHQEVGIAEL